MIYARLNPDTGAVEARDFAAPPPASKGWLLLTVVPPPTPAANEVAEMVVQVSGGVAIQVWTLRPKTQREIDADDDGAEIAQVRAAITALKQEIAGTSSLTAAQFRTLAARVLLFLLRRSVGGG